MVSLWSREREASWLQSPGKQGTKDFCLCRASSLCHSITGQHTAGMSSLPQAPPCPIVYHQEGIPYEGYLTGPGRHLSSSSCPACSVCSALSWVLAGCWRKQRKVECSLPPRSGWPDMPSEGASYNVGYTLRKLCDVSPEDDEWSLEIGLHGGFS